MIAQIIRILDENRCKSAIFRSTMKKLSTGYQQGIDKVSTGYQQGIFRVTLGSGLGVVRGKRAKRYEPVKNPYANGKNASHGLLISSRDSNDYFTKQDAVKQAEVLGVNQRTMED